MKSWVWSIVFSVTIGVMYATGLLFHLISWCETNVGSWLFPVTIIVFGLISITFPIGRAIREGMRDAKGRAA